MTSEPSKSSTCGRSTVVGTSTGIRRLRAARSCALAGGLLTGKVPPHKCQIQWSRARSMMCRLGFSPTAWAHLRRDVSKATCSRTAARGPLIARLPSRPLVAAERGSLLALATMQTTAPSPDVYFPSIGRCYGTPSCPLAASLPPALREQTRREKDVSQPTDGGHRDKPAEPVLRL